MSETTAFRWLRAAEPIKLGPLMTIQPNERFATSPEAYDELVRLGAAVPDGESHVDLKVYDTPLTEARPVDVPPVDTPPADAPHPAPKKPHGKK